MSLRSSAKRDKKPTFCGWPSVLAIGMSGEVVWTAVVSMLKLYLVEL